jgi:hypothetical protein
MTMNAKTLLAGTTIALVLAAAAATPANAVVTTFANFSALSTYNFYYKNPSSNGHSATASFYTIATPTATTAGSVPVSFSFINEGAALDGAVSGVTALFTLAGTTSGPAVLDPFTHSLEEYTSATFSYKTTTAITVGTHHYAAGSTLLQGTYSNGILVGKNSQGNIVADNDTTFGPDTLTFSSDFVTFQPSAALGLSFSLGSIFPSPVADAMVGTYALKTFKANSGGQFTADPVPHVNAVPEPASWALMIVGFGLAGASIRRRTRLQAAV